MDLDYVVNINAHDSDPAAPVRRFPTVQQARAYARGQLDVDPAIRVIAIGGGPDQLDVVEFIDVDSPCPARCSAGRWVLDEPVVAAEEPPRYADKYSGSARSEDAVAAGDGLFLYPVERCAACGVYDDDLDAARAEGDDHAYAGWGWYKNAWGDGRPAAYVFTTEPL